MIPLRYHLLGHMPLKLYSPPTACYCSISSVSLLSYFGSQEDCCRGLDRVTGLGACPILEAIFIQGYLAPGEILLKAI